MPPLWLLIVDCDDFSVMWLERLKAITIAQNAVLKSAHDKHKKGF
jgi:hypothetical protein